MIRTAAGHRWPLLVAVLATALVAGWAVPATASATADLALTVVDTPDPAVLGDTLTIRASVRNNGDEIAYDVVVGFAQISNAAVGSAPGCSIAANFAACGILTIVPGQTRSVTITLTDLELDEASLYANATSADIDGVQVVDPTPADNQVHMTTVVEQAADIKLELSAISPVTIGNTTTVTATVSNTGAGTARGVTLQVAIPLELPLAGAPEGCSATALKVTCNLGTIGSQVTVTRALTMRVPTEGSFVLLGGVTHSRPDTSDTQGQVTITGLSPIEPADNGPPPTTPEPKPALPKPQAVPIGLITSGVPTGRRCIRARTLRFRLKRPSGILLTQADVYLGTRRIKRLTGASLTKRVVLTKLPRGRYTVVVVASLQDGGRLSGRRVLRACR